MRSQIDTDSKGCLSGQGSGAGHESPYCPGSGGSNGGQAGAGFAYNSKHLCSAPHVLGGFEGSGGASGIYNAKLGGSGGGIINITA